MILNNTNVQGPRRITFLRAMCLVFLPMIYLQFATLHAQHTYELIRIPVKSIPNIQFLQSLGLEDDHGIHKNGAWYESIADEYAREKVKEQGIPFQVIVPDMEDFYASRLRQEYPALLKQFNGESILAPKNFAIGSMGGYYKLEEIYKEMDRVVQFANMYFVSQDTIGLTSEQRPIIAWTFGSSKKEKQPSTLLTALHHAREPGGATTLLYFLWDLLERAIEKNPEAMYLMSERKLVIVPCLNPDGYAFNQSQRPEGGGLWRKNRRIIDAKTFGVDLNRNYGPESFWNANNGGSSTEANSDLYRGDAPFSEPETQAIKTLCSQYAFGCIFNYHSYSNLLIYPFAALSRETEDSSTFRGFAADATRFNAYSAGRDLETVGYTTRGNSDDWAYNEYKALAFTPEVGAITDGFWPSPTRIIPHAKENLHMNYQALWSSGSNLCIRLAEKSIDSLSFANPSIGALDIDIQNIGRLHLKEPSSISIQSLRQDIVILDSVITIDSIASGERISRTIRFEVLKNYRNGDPARFVISRMQHGISRIDTAIISLYKPTVFDVFVRDTDKGSFQLGTWNTIVRPGEDAILEDSPGFMYKPLTDNYAMYVNDLDLSEFRKAHIQLETQWNIEPMSDFGIIQVSTDKGATWEFLKTSRMIKGSGISGGKQDGNGFGFQGNMPEWEFQKADLSGLLKKSVRFRFGMLSDDGAEFNGFAIRNVRVLAFADSFNAIDDSKISQVKTTVFPMPATGDYIVVVVERNMQDSPLSVSFGIYDHLGKQVSAPLKETLYEKEIMLSIPISALPAGLYHLNMLDNNGHHQVVSFPIIR
ncbi:hypothetical protein EBV26_10490 [bacterium]|nr:hypothetical protein [bacterium]